MTPDEKALLQNLFDRIEAAKDQPRDKEAEMVIADAMRMAPYAPYLLTQTILLQEQALKQADQRLHELETRLHELEQPKDEPTSFLGGLGAPFLSGRKTASGVPSVSRAPQPQTQSQQPQPQQAQPQYEPQPSIWNRGGYAPQASGNGFLGSALSTAAGVAGGALLFEGISSLFRGGHAYGFGGIGGMPMQETVYENVNIYENGGPAQANFPNDVPLPPDHQAFDGSDNVIRDADFGGSDFDSSDFGGGGGDDGGWV